MLYARARLRYLAALGLPALAAPIVACSAGENGGNTTPTATVTVTGEAPATTAAATATASETEPVSTATATPTASATATETKTETAAAKTWVPEKDPRQTTKAQTPTKPPRIPLPTCPSGLVCTVAPASLNGAAAAPAPYASCAAETTLGPDAMAMGPRGVHTTFEPLTTAQERKKEPAACCYAWVQPCAGGRPFRGEEGEILAGATRRGDWLAEIGSLAIVREMGSRDKEIAAAHYGREAAFEHAAIAAFSRAAMGLLGLGAPPEILADTHAAAMDEVEHARIAFALASAFAGETRGPARLSVSGQKALPGTHGELCAETFLDACVGETVAALALREAAACSEDWVLAGLLSRIAEDEERHAALAWRTVAWGLREGGAEARRAFEQAVEEVRREASKGVRGVASMVEHGQASMPAPGEGQSDLRACGILGDSALTEVRRRALHEVVLPCAAALLSPARHEASQAAVEMG